MQAVLRKLCQRTGLMLANLSARFVPPRFTLKHILLEINQHVQLRTVYSMTLYFGMNVECRNTYYTTNVVNIRITYLNNYQSYVELNSL